MTVGATLPTVTCVARTPNLPDGSVTRSAALYWPSSVYVWVTVAPVASKVPSPLKSHS